MTAGARSASSPPSACRDTCVKAGTIRASRHGDATVTRTPAPIAHPPFVRIAHLTDLHLACLQCAINEGHPGRELTELLRLTEATSVDGILAALLLTGGAQHERILQMIRRAVAEYRLLCDETVHACV